MSFKKIWNFIWHSDSLLSWIVNVILAFILVKFIIYPGLGLVLQTTHPVVAVVSKSMEHNSDFDAWWQENSKLYESYNINKQDFINYPMKNGFNKGDIIFLKSAKNVKIGDIIVFKGNSANPIIHRVVKIHDNGNYQTKGDNNPDSFNELGETNINKNEVIGKAFFRLPLLGWVKILFTDLINVFR
ncbi:MAG: signal peptidase I, partial [Nanoarchaeota archaeon]